MSKEKDVKERPDLQEKLSELDILKQSLDSTKDQLLRLGADFENFRKRAEARVRDARAYGKEEVLLEVMTLNDALTHAVNASEKTQDMESFKKGLQLVYQQFEKFLVDQGLVAIESIGEPFDPSKHEALSQEENDEVEEGTVLGEIQKGYMMADRVIRTAKVKVATKPKTKV